MNIKIKTIRVTGKTTDRCHIEFLDAEGQFVGEREGYVPDYFPGDHYGDYLELEIDVETGQILNWEKPTQKQLKNSVQ